MTMGTLFTILFSIFGVFIAFSVIRSIRVIPSKTAVVVERLGKYNKTLEAGFHVLMPFLDRVRYRHSLKEQALDVPTQPCFTQDNVRIEVNGVLYFRVMDPSKASYGTRDYRYATVQLAQTTMRSVIGKMELDRTFEERDRMNASILQSLDEATDQWGVKVTRYEIQNITVPDTILTSMENQMRAEREKRAEIARSIGVMESKINHSIGIMEEAVNRSQGDKERQINEAEGRAEEIRTLAKATAESLRKVAAALETPGGESAVNLQISEAYIRELQNLAKEGTKLILPMNLGDISSVMQTLKKLSEE